MDGIFVLYDSDEHYAIRFMEYFKKKRDLGFELAVFTGLQSLKEFLQDHFVDILLLGENTQVTDQELNPANIRHIYKLSDKTGVAHDAGYTVINKYQMLQAIISDIKADYARHEINTRINGLDQPKIVTIINPAHEVESLIFTWSTGILLSEQKRVLVISLELLPVRVISTVDYSNQTLTELIYYIKESEDIITHQKALVSYQGSLAYLAGIANGADILALNKADMQRWITILRTQAEYELIIFYADSNCEAVQELVILSDTVIVSSGNRLYAELLYNEWQVQMKRTVDRLDQNKLIKLAIPENTSVHGLPLTILELSQTECWTYAQQQLDKFF